MAPEVLSVGLGISWAKLPLSLTTFSLPVPIVGVEEPHAALPPATAALTIWL